MSILYIDTESDPVTKELICIQTMFNGRIRIFNDFPADTFDLLHLIQLCTGIIMFNAPYDLGVIARVSGFYSWVDNHWLLRFGQFEYTVRRLNFHGNVIRPQKKSPPVIDLLKLWSIFIDNQDISLKALIRRELKEDVIEYSEADSRTAAYQEQDVICLEKLWHVFLERVRTITDVAGYNLADWARICSPATVTKDAYKRAYPSLRDYSVANADADKSYGVEQRVSDSYHGGLTIAYHRGECRECKVYDIKSAYANVIIHENTDSYLNYTWEEYNGPLMRDGVPILCECLTDTILSNFDGSFRVYHVSTPAVEWMWSYDVLAARLLFDADITVKRMLRLVPLVPVPQSLPTVWSRCRDEEIARNGKTVLSQFYKLLSNTSYGIKAQRKPFTTPHTNMAVAGVITSRARLILAEMVDEARKHGGRWVYSDTDSIFVTYSGDGDELLSALNKRIYPYRCEHEFSGDVYILSLKRYFEYTYDEQGGRVLHNLRLHGTACYSIRGKELWDMFCGTSKLRRKPLRLRGLTANTLRTYDRILKLCPQIKTPHPFMFTDPPESDVSYDDWYRRWYTHIDTKTTWAADAKASETFERRLPTYANVRHAMQSYLKFKRVAEYTEDGAYIDWDDALPYYDDYKYVE